MLVAVEVLIAGMALYVIGGAGDWSSHSGSGFWSMHRMAFAAAPIAPILAGAAPQITVDDPDSRVVVGVSNDGMVHVKDLTSVSGNIWGGSENISQLHVTHSGDTVSIVRPSDGMDNVHFMWFGDMTRRVEVDAPAGTRLVISKSGGADVTGLTGAVNVHSVDGHITLNDLRGTAVADSADGYVEATNVHADALTLTSADGHIGLKDISVATLTARTHDGHITGDGVTIAGAQPSATIHSDDGSVHVTSASFAGGGTYEVSSMDGRVELGLAPGSDLTVAASTADGTIYVDGNTVSHGDGDAAQHTIKLGNGSGNLKVSSADGSIHIHTNNGAF